MRLFNQKLRYNLQFFAADGDGSQEESENAGKGDNSQEKLDEEKRFTQKEVDDLVAKRLARERKKIKTQKKDKSGNNSEERSISKETDQKVAEMAALKEKIFCYEYDIAKEYSKEAIALAKTYLDENSDMDEAMEKVIKKFPMFTKGSESKEQENKEKILMTIIGFLERI